jgi:hypothetical protein
MYRSWHSPIWDPLSLCPCLIYALIDPRTDKVRYVGRTIRSKHRPKEHLRRGGPLKRAWVEELKAVGLEPRFIGLEHGEWTLRQAIERENFWTAHYGEGLLNRESTFRRER